jgi:hypothetical protein
VNSLVEIVRLAPAAVQRVGSLLVIDLAEAESKLKQVASNGGPIGK